jgi:hypothetical protein
MAMAQGILPLEQAAMVLAIKIPPRMTQISLIISYHNYLPFGKGQRLLFVKKSL